jgi:hypothetical protein
MSTTGIVYTTTGQRERGSVAGYHRKPEANFLNKTAHRVDVAGLKPIDQRNAIKFDGSTYDSKFTIGFEVEKNQLSRGAVREYELFCGFETDASCGYEAVTHILPLLPAGQWRTKVYDMMHKAEKIIDDRYSPSDKRCGGHITIAVDGMNGDDLREAVRKNSGIVLALFRHRLNNTYCGSNRRMQSANDSTFNSYSGSGAYGSRERHWKYQTALVKGNCLEFRCPSKFESVKQMMRRYELYYELVNFSVNNPNGSHDSFLKKIKPIIVSMYNGDTAKAEQILGLSKLFRKFILKGEIHQDIAKFLK